MNVLESLESICTVSSICTARLQGEALVRRISSVVSEPALRVRIPTCGPSHMEQQKIFPRRSRTLRGE
jgi:hypothetical protein